jgi:pyruvate dehydrogenase (quinone)
VTTRARESRIGAGARGTASHLTELATLLGAGVAKALLGKDVLSDDLLFVTGAIGLLGTEPSWELMQGCDTLLMVGIGFPWSEFLPKDGVARAVQIDIDAYAFVALSRRCQSARRRRRDVEGTPSSDPAQGRARVGEQGRVKRACMVEETGRARDGGCRTSKPATGSLGNVAPLPANAIVTCHSGSCANWYARDYRVKQGYAASLSGGLASMGAAVPYAIGAKFAHPDRPVIALVGDGAMQMNNLAELITVQKYWKRWADPRWIVCVFNNQDLNEVTWEQRVMESNPKFNASQNIPDAYAQFGEMLGFRGIYVDSPDRLAEA